MRNTIALSILAVALVFAQGCGEEKLSQQEASQVFGAAAAAAGQVQASVWAGMAQQPAGADSIEVNGFVYEWDESSFSFTGTVNSPEGGSAAVVGTGSYDEAADYATFDFEMTFNGWVSQGLTLDGVLSLSFEGGQQYFKLTYAGNVDASGQVDGNATFALTVEYKQDGTITYTGTVGGQKMGGSVNLNDYNVPSY
jgi:hypothetical protein